MCCHYQRSKAQVSLISRLRHSCRSSMDHIKSIKDNSIWCKEKILLRVQNGSFSYVLLKGFCFLRNQTLQSCGVVDWKHCHFVFQGFLLNYAIIPGVLLAIILRITLKDIFKKQTDIFETKPPCKHPGCLNWLQTLWYFINIFWFKCRKKTTNNLNKSM